MNTKVGEILGICRDSRRHRGRVTSPQGARGAPREPRSAAKPRRTAWIGVILLAIGGGGAAGCASTRGGLPVSAPPASGLTEESLVEVQRPKLEIVELRELRDAPGAPGTKEATDRAQWVAGTVRNPGRVPVSRLVVKVSDLDDQGRKLSTVLATPEEDRLAPGESTGFTARLPRSTAGTSYHVEATGDGPPAR